jgi:anthranilate synthase component 2
MPRSAPILVVDNHDSFTFNLVHAIEALTESEVRIFQREEVAASELSEYARVVLAPGPGLPQESAALMALVEASMLLQKPILGVCLGHQALAVASGGRLKNLERVHHGVSHSIHRVDVHCQLFWGLPENIFAGRYHSWVVEEGSLSAKWVVTCRDTDGEIMAMRHVDKPFYGVQFHPESIMTPEGRDLLSNFLQIKSL